MQDENEKLAKSLLKKAMGYTVDEVVEEYVQEEDGLKLVKKKITTKHIPPDINAARALLERCFTEEDELKNMTDDELEAFRMELIEKLNKGVKNANRSVKSKGEVLC